MIHLSPGGKGGNDLVHLNHPLCPSLALSTSCMWHLSIWSIWSTSLSLEHFRYQDQVAKPNRWFRAALGLLHFEVPLWGQCSQVAADVAVSLKADMQDVFSMSRLPCPPAQVIDFRAHAPSHLVQWVFRVHSLACGALSMVIQLETQECD